MLFTIYFQAKQSSEFNLSYYTLSQNNLNIRVQTDSVTAEAGNTVYVLLTLHTAPTIKYSFFLRKFRLFLAQYTVYVNTINMLVD